MSPDAPLFSIIIPTYNAGDKLARTVDSIRAQQVSDVEIVVRDAQSNDGTAAYLAAQTDIQWASEADDGLFDAMNRGIVAARGQWLAFFGAGDLLHPGALEAIRSLAWEHRDAAALIYGDAWLCPQQAIYGGAFPPSKLRSWTPCHQAIFYNRRVFDLVGNYEIQYRIAADYALNLSCWGKPEIKKFYLPVIICDFEGGGVSATSRDEIFEADKMRLIRHRLGLSNFLKRKVELAMPEPLKEARRSVITKLAKRKSQS